MENRIRPRVRPGFSTPMSSLDVPLFDPAAVYRHHQAAIDAALGAVLASGRYIQGPPVAALETALAEAAGGGEAVAVASGTDALLLALLGDGIGPGDAVFLPTFTYVATAGAVRLAGASPVFVDVAPATLSLDRADLARQIARVRGDGRLTPRAVIAVDLFGHPADLDPLGDLAEDAGLLLIADAAQSLGCRHRGRPVAARATVTATSFYPTKPLGCAGDGGMLFARAPGRAADWRRRRSHGVGADGVAESLGMNARLDSLQAAYLLALLPDLDAARARRARIAQGYSDALAGLAVLPPPDDAETTPAWALYTLRTPRRDALARALRAAGIASGVYYGTPLHLHPAYRAFGDGPGSLPVAERAATEVLSLPCHAEMTANDAARVAETARAALVATGTP